MHCPLEIILSLLDEACDLVIESVKHNSNVLEVRWQCFNVKCARNEQDIVQVRGEEQVRDIMARLANFVLTDILDD